MIAQRQIDRDVVEVAIHAEVVPGRLARDTKPAPGQLKAPNFNRSKKLIQRGELGAELKDYEWAHLFGPGWGDEAEAGLMLAHPDINRALQTDGPLDGLEGKIRQIATEVREKGGTMRLTVTGRNFGGLPHDMTRGAPVLSEVKYEVNIIMPDGNTGQWTAEIVAPPPTLGAKVNFDNVNLGALDGVWAALGSK